VGWLSKLSSSSEDDPVRRASGKLTVGVLATVSLSRRPGAGPGAFVHDFRCINCTDGVLSSLRN